MSAVLPPPPPPYSPQPAVGGAVLDVSSTAPVPFWRLCLVEFRKSWDTRAGLWYLFAIAAVITLIESIILIVGLAQDQIIRFEDNAYIAGSVTVLLLPVLAIMLVTGEWTQRSAMVSFTLEPRRVRVVLAKLAVSVAYVLATLVMMLLVAAVTAGISGLVQPELTEWDLEIAPMLGFSLFQAFTLVIGFAFGALLLNTPAAIVLFFFYWYVLPVLLAWAGTISDGLGDALEWVNFQIAVGPLTDWSMDTGEEWGRLLVSGLVWIALPLGLGIARILRAEVK